MIIAVNRCVLMRSPVSVLAESFPVRRFSAIGTLQQWHGIEIVRASRIGWEGPLAYDADDVDPRHEVKREK